MSDTMDWYYPNPHIETWCIDSSHLDHYNHVNNVAYVAQQEKVAWAHSASLGLSFSDYQSLDRAMVVHEHKVKFLQPCLENDTVLCATWITGCDNKLTLTRDFQYICKRRKTTVYKAQTLFVCTTLSSGKPARMPEVFRTVYGNALIGVEA